MTQLDEITGIILVGGKSRRMGQDKALLPIQGKLMIERVLELFLEQFPQVLLIGDRPERFEHYQLPVLPDIFPGSSLGGLFTGLQHAASEHIFVASCDLPFPNQAILQHCCGLRQEFDAVVPCSEQGPEPLFACYRKSCLPAMRAQLEEGRFNITTLFPHLLTHLVPYPELAPYDIDRTAFLNLNTPIEFARLTGPPLSGP